MKVVLSILLCSLFAHVDDVLTIYAHRPNAVQMTMINHMAAARMVPWVATSCACLTVESAARTGETPVPPVAEDCASYSNNMIYPLLKGTLS